MYSHEIQQLMELRNYLLGVKEYLHICNTSPQINYIHYDAWQDNFKIATDDRYEWTFKVKEKRK